MVEGLATRHKQCLHCGLPSRSSDFCCSGCDAAYQLIRSFGLEGFYQHAIDSNKALGESRLQDEDQYEIYNDKEFLDRYSRVVGDGRREALFRIEGLYCTACIWLLEKLPQMDSNCVSAEVRFSKSQLYLQWKEGQNHLKQILILLRRLGYPAEFLEQDHQKIKIFDREILRLGITAAFAFAVMHIGLFFLGTWSAKMDSSMAKNLGFISAGLLMPVLFFGAAPFFKNSLYALRYGRLHADALIVGSILIAFSYSLYETYQGRTDVYYDSVGMLIFLLLAGRMLIRKANDFFSKPLSMSATKMLGTELVRVPSFQLKKQDRLVLKKNESLAVDSFLVSNECWVDQAVVTGESVPQRYVQGQMLSQGSRLLSESAHFLTATSYSDSSLNRLVERLKDVRMSEAASVLEQVFVLSILLLSVFVFFFSKDQPLAKTVGVLIVACPCALSLSRPLVLEALRRQAYQIGISVFNFERVLGAHKKNKIIFDKTGTLTESEFGVSASFDPIFSASDASLLYSMVLRSNHPYSRAIAYHLQNRFSPKIIEPESFNEVFGQGLHSVYQAERYFVGKSRSDEEGVGFYKSDQQRAFFKFSYTLREDAKEVLDQLRDHKMKLSLFTGDTERSTNVFLQKLGFRFDQVFSGMSPQDKERHTDSDSVFVGDGMNDASAMNQSGFSIGFYGSAEANLNSADIYLMDKKLKHIPNFLRATRLAERRIFVNHVVSLLYNGLTISLVLTGAIGPIVCALFMPLSSLSVIGISNIGRFFEKKK